MRFLFNTIVVIFACTLPSYMVKGECKPQTFNTTSGTIEYPDKLVAEDKKCTFKLQQKDAPGFVTLYLSNIMLSPGGKLEMYDGEVKVGKKLFTVSGNNVPQQVGIFFSNNVNIEYTVGDLKTPSNWSISYNSDECKSEVENSWSVRVGHPKFLLTDKKTFECEYTVTSSLPASRIPVASMQLALSDKSSLKLTSGDEEKTFTDKTAAEDFFPSNRTAPIVVGFKVMDAGIKSEYSVVVDALIQSCSERLEVNGTKETFILNIPANHPVQYSCRSEFVAKSATARLMATLTNLTLVDGSDLGKLLDGGSSSSMFDEVLTSNPTVGDLVTTTGSSLIVSLRLGNAAGERLIVMDISSTEDGGRFVGQGQLSAGNVKAEGDAVHRISAYYQLVASQGKVVNIDVLSSLPENATLSFYDGLQTTCKLITVFTSKTTEMFAVVGGSEMLVVLDQFPATENFTASFYSVESECNKLLTSASGQLSFSNMGTFNGTQNCTLTIAPYDTPVGAIVLNFDSLSVGDGEYVIISTGSDKVVTQFSKELGQASEVYLSGATMAEILIMNGGDAKTRTSLTGRYSVIPQVCGGELTKAKGDIMTPNYPNSYPLNAECSWAAKNLTAVKEDDDKPTTFLYLNFESMNLAPGHSLSVSQFKNGSTEKLANFGGNVVPSDFIVPVTQGLAVKFSAPPKGTIMKNRVGQGAKVSYNLVSCGGNLSDASGKLSSPGYPKAPTKSAMCMWIVQVADMTDGDNGTNIVSMSISLTDKAATALPDSMKIYDGDSMRSSIMSVKVAKGSAKVLSRYNKVVVQYTYEAGSKASKNIGFNVDYSTFYCNSSELCDNGICLHPDWRCNEVDDCGDFTDEKGCVPQPTPSSTPKPSEGQPSGYVKGGIVALLFFIALLLGAALTLFVPMIVRKVRGRGRNYSRMNDNTPSVA